MNFKLWLEKQNESFVNTAIDMAANTFGLPSPSELGVDLDPQKIGGFTKYMAGRLNLIPLDKNTETKYTNLCSSKPQTGINFTKHKANIIQACNILCNKYKNATACQKAGCKPKRLRNRSISYSCPPTNNDFHRDQNGNIIGAE